MSSPASFPYSLASSFPFSNNGLSLPLPLNIESATIQEKTSQFQPQESINPAQFHLKTNDMYNKIPLESLELETLESILLILLKYN